jgi:hypothetical protein
MVLETNRSRLLNVWGGAWEYQREFKSGWASPPYSLLLPAPRVLSFAAQLFSCEAPAHSVLARERADCCWS